MSQRKIAVIAALLIVAIFILPACAVIFLGSGGNIEGKWIMVSANLLNDDGSVNQEASDYYGVSAEDDGWDGWWEFLPDGTFLMGDSEGVDPTVDDATWSVRGNTLTLNSESEVMEYQYHVGRDTLTLQTEVYWGWTIEIVLERA